MASYLLLLEKAEVSAGASRTWVLHFTVPSLNKHRAAGDKKRASLGPV